jgi:hypothetical protein
MSEKLGEIYRKMVEFLGTSIESDEAKEKRWQEYAKILLQFRTNRRGHTKFVLHGIIPTDIIFDAILKEAEMYCALNNDYGDHCEGMTTEIDVSEIWDKSTQKILYYVIQHNDPNHESSIITFQ